MTRSSAPGQAQQSVDFATQSNQSKTPGLRRGARPVRWQRPLA